MDLSGADLDNVTRTILAEVGPHASPAEMASIASVIRNRLAAGGYGNTPSSIVRAPHQFTPWSNPDAPNFPAKFAADSAAYKQAEALARGVFNGVVQDHTNGATHYYAPAAQAANNAIDPERNPLVPSFAQGPPLATIGGHQFYAPSGGQTPGNAPGGPATVTPYSGPGSVPTPQNMPTPPPPTQTQLAGGGLLGNLLFGRQGIMGMFPQQIQQQGILGSAVSGLGGALKGAFAPAPTIPSQAPQMASTPSPAPAQSPQGLGLLQQLFGGAQASA